MRLMMYKARRRAVDHLVLQEWIVGYQEGGLPSRVSVRQGEGCPTSVGPAGSAPPLAETAPLLFAEKELALGCSMGPMGWWR